MPDDAPEPPITDRDVKPDNVPPAREWSAPEDNSRRSFRFKRRRR